MRFIMKNFPTERDEIFIWEKCPTKLADFIFALTDFDFSIEIFYQVRSSLIEALTLSRWVFLLNINTHRRCNMIPGVFSE